MPLRHPAVGRASTNTSRAPAPRRRTDATVLATIVTTRKTACPYCHRRYCWRGVSHCRGQLRGCTPNSSRSSRLVVRTVCGLADAVRRRAEGVSISAMRCDRPDHAFMTAIIPSRSRRCWRTMARPYAAGSLSLSQRRAWINQRSRRLSGPSYRHTSPKPARPPLTVPAKPEARNGRWSLPAGGAAGLVSARPSWCRDTL